MYLLMITILLLLFFTLVLKKSLLLSASLSLIAVIVILFISGEFQTNKLISSALHGLLVAAEISLLIFGALLFYNYLKAGGFIERLETSLQNFSTNRLVIVIMLAFFFGSFIEGVSGFGTPAMIIAPLLLGLRFPAYLAAALPLLANTVPVLFGAVGTPVKIGLAGLPAEQIPFYATLLMALPALLIPVVFKRFLADDTDLKNINGNVRSYLLAVLAGISFIIPFIAFSLTGPEFPSMAASLTGLMLWLLMIKTMGHSSININPSSLLQLFRTFKPYLFIALLLVAAKFLLGNRMFIVEWQGVGLSKSIGYFQPGVIFVIGLLLLMLFSKNKKVVSLADVLKQTAQRLPGTFATIACLAIIAKLLSQNLDVNELLGNNTIPSALYYVLAVFTGFIGSFIAGSATVSNLMFGAEWYAVGQQLHLNIPLLLAAQLAGAALGNALSVQNIAMVQAVLNEKGLERAVIGKLWKPVLLFLILISIAVVILGLLNAV